MSQRIESTDAAAPRKISPTGRGGPDTDALAKRVAHLGASRVREICQLAWRWWKAGHRHPATVSALVDLYVSRRHLIAKPFAYFNPGGQAFADIYANTSARQQEAEWERLKRIDSEATATRARIRRDLEHAARYDSSEDYCP